MASYDDNILRRQLFRGTPRKLKGLLRREGINGELSSNGDFYEFHSTNSTIRLGWWRSSGEIVLEHGREIKPRPSSNRMSRTKFFKKNTKWIEVERPKSRALSVAEYAFRHPFELMYGLEGQTPNTLDQISNAMALLGSVKLPKQYDHHMVCHKFLGTSEKYLGFDIVEKNAPLERQRGRYVVDDVIDLWLPGNIFAEEFEDDYWTRPQECLRVTTRIARVVMAQVMRLCGNGERWTCDKFEAFFEDADNFKLDRRPSRTDRGNL